MPVERLCAPHFPLLSLHVNGSVCHHIWGVAGPPHGTPRPARASPPLSQSCTWPSLGPGGLLRPQLSAPTSPQPGERVYHTFFTVPALCLRNASLSHRPQPQHVTLLQRKSVTTSQQQTARPCACEHCPWARPLRLPALPAFAAFTSAWAPDGFHAQRACFSQQGL